MFSLNQDYIRFFYQYNRYLLSDETDVTEKRVCAGGRRSLRTPFFRETLLMAELLLHIVRRRVKFVQIREYYDNISGICCPAYGFPQTRKLSLVQITSS